MTVARRVVQTPPNAATTRPGQDCHVQSRRLEAALLPGSNATCLDFPKQLYCTRAHCVSLTRPARTVALALAPTSCLRNDMANKPHLLGFDRWLGPAIEDAYEETFLLFSESFPSHNLGFIDSKAAEIELELAGRTLTLKQSPTLLTSQREAGTTGAVLWKITPMVGEWLASMPAFLRDAKCLDSNSCVVEIGCGITGLIGIVVAPEVGTYVLTDQSYVMKVLQQNIAANLPTSRAARKGAKVHTSLPTAVPLDWEINTPSLDGLGLSPDQSIDLLVVCDCVYNDYLIKPLVRTLVDVCRLNTGEKQAAVLIAQQLRSENIFEEFLAALLEFFMVWRVTDDFLPIDLRAGTGYAVHLAVPKTRVQ